MSRHAKFLSAALAAVTTLTGGLALADPGSTSSAAAAGSSGSLEKRVERLERELTLRPKDVSAYRMPDEVSFCGEKVDLTNPVIRERLETEFLLVLGDRAQVVLWSRRAERVFPTIEAEARIQGTCADLKYLAVTESGLRPAVTSRASAKGWWQFMSGTAKDFGLDTRRTWDQRADLREATRAGLKYLAGLNRQFGSWSLAMAAYNTGPGRVRRAQRAQGLKDFWRLDLYTEAERYVPRTIAIKTVMSNLEKYGFHIEPEHGFERRARGFVKVRIPSGRSISVLDAARGSDIDLRTLRTMNPELGADVLPEGREVTVEVPAGKERQFRTWLTSAIKKAPRVAKSPRKARKRSSKKTAKSKKKSRGKGVASGRASKKKSAKKIAKKKSSRRTYKVRSGDSLWDIAQRNKCSVKELRKWNKLGRRSVLKPGQKLVVRR